MLRATSGLQGWIGLGIVGDIDGVGVSPGHADVFQKGLERQRQGGSTVNQVNSGATDTPVPPPSQSLQDLFRVRLGRQPKGPITVYGANAYATGLPPAEAAVGASFASAASSRSASPSQVLASGGAATARSRVDFESLQNFISQFEHLTSVKNAFARLKQFPIAEQGLIRVEDMSLGIGGIVFVLGAIAASSQGVAYIESIIKVLENLRDQAPFWVANALGEIGASSQAKPHVKRIISVLEYLTNKTPSTVTEALLAILDSENATPEHFDPMIEMLRELKNIQLLMKPTQDLSRINAALTKIYASPLVTSPQKKEIDEIRALRRTLK